MCVIFAPNDRRQPSNPSALFVASSFFCVLIVALVSTGGISPRVGSEPDRLAGRRTVRFVLFVLFVLLGPSLFRFHKDKAAIPATHI